MTMATTKFMSVPLANLPDPTRYQYGFVVVSDMNNALYYSDGVKWAIYTGSSAANQGKRTIVYMGHSYASYASDPDSYFGSSTAGITSDAKSYARAPFNQALIQMGQPLEVIANIGVAGLTSTQILATQLSRVLALAPGYVWFHGISNDAYNSIPADTTIANLKTIFDTLTAAGICVLTGPDFPRSSVTDAIALAQGKVYAWLSDYGRANPGIVVVDCYNYFTDLSSFANAYNAAPDTTKFLNESGFYIHPNTPGSINAATAWVAALKRIGIPINPSGVFIGADGATHGDLDNLVRNPKMIGSGGSFGAGCSGTAVQNSYTYRATGSAMTGTCSVVTRASVAATFPGLFDDGANGYLQKISLAAATAANEIISFSPGFNTTKAFTEGEGPFVFEAEVAYNASAGSINQLYMQFAQSGAPYYKVVANVSTDSGDYLAQSKYYGRIRSRRFYMPATAAAGVALTVMAGTTIGGTGDLYIGNMAIRKVQV